MGFIKLIQDVASGDILKNPLKTGLSMATLGLSDSVSDAQDAIDGQKKLKSPDPLAPPPTLDDVQKNLDKNNLTPKTYGRMGSIRNAGGAAGLAANTLNLSSQTLTGS